MGVSTICHRRRDIKSVGLQPELSDTLGSLIAVFMTHSGRHYYSFLPIIFTCGPDASEAAFLHSRGNTQASTGAVGHYLYV